MARVRPRDRAVAELVALVEEVVDWSKRAASLVEAAIGDDERGAEEEGGASAAELRAAVEEGRAHRSCQGAGPARPVTTQAVGPTASAHRGLASPTAGGACGVVLGCWCQSCNRV